MNNTNTQSTNKLVVPGAKQALDQMKYEIANEFGVNLGPETSSRMNGSVGGEITKRLVQMGEQNIGNSANFQAKQIKWTEKNCLFLYFYPKLTY